MIGIFRPLKVLWCVVCATKQQASHPQLVQLLVAWKYPEHGCYPRRRRLLLMRTTLRISEQLVEKSQSLGS